MLPCQPTILYKTKLITEKIKTSDTQHGTLNAERGTQNTEHGTRNTERRTQNTERSGVERVLLPFTYPFNTFLKY